MYRACWNFTQHARHIFCLSYRYPESQRAAEAAGSHVLERIKSVLYCTLGKQSNKKTLRLRNAQPKL